MFISLAMAFIQWPQPEQDSQANRTWSNIVENSSKQHSCSETKLVIESHAAVDYIPLESGENSDVFLNKKCC